MAFISGEQRPNFGGYKGKGTGNIRKLIFDFWRTGEQANLFQGNKVPPGGLIIICMVLICVSSTHVCTVYVFTANKK